MLNRVLLNLVTNAIKFTDHGRIEIVAESVGGDDVAFTVRDTGRGMAADEVEDLFVLFGRSRSFTVRLPHA
ncbi:MAG: ATP-binding protein [Gemmatimonadota bacterium]